MDAYNEEEVPTAQGKTETRVVLRLHPALAPVKVAILPLSRNEALGPLTKNIYDSLLAYGRWPVEYDDTQSIGRRYRRFDEIGTPYCVTDDFQSLEDGQVTIRERDSMEQERIPIEGLAERIQQKLEN